MRRLRPGARGWIEGASARLPRSRVDRDAGKARRVECDPGPGLGDDREACSCIIEIVNRAGPWNALKQDAKSKVGPRN